MLIAPYNDGILFSPACASITPPVTRIPERAVIKPTASTFLTSSYVNVPPILTLPVKLPDAAFIEVAFTVVGFKVVAVKVVKV